MMSPGFLRRLFGGYDRTTADPPARLTAEEAERIARDDAAGHWQASELVLRDRQVENGRVLWQFWTATIGSSLEVDVDDTTGGPTVRRFGGR